MTRGGMDIIERVAELRPLRSHPIPMVIDGELVAEAGRADDFYKISPRLRKRRDAASPGLAFVAFDLLWLDGKPLVDWPCEARRELLEAAELPVGACVTKRWPGSEASRLVDACGDLGVEGIVMKRLASPYRPGERSPDWRKSKVEGGPTSTRSRRVDLVHAFTSREPGSASGGSGGDREFRVSSSWPRPVPGGAVACQPAGRGWDRSP
jgi:ATP-dependent DNA ligase